MSDPKERLRSGVVSIIKNHAEEPDEVTEGDYGKAEIYKAQQMIDDLVQLFNQEIVKRVEKARVKELQWAMYSIGDLHMERVGVPDIDVHTEWVERDRRMHHKIIEQRLATLNNQTKDNKS